MKIFSALFYVSVLSFSFSALAFKPTNCLGQFADLGYGAIFGGARLEITCDNEKKFAKTKGFCITSKCQKTMVKDMILQNLGANFKQINDNKSIDYFITNDPSLDQSSIIFRGLRTAFIPSNQRDNSYVQRFSIQVNGTSHSTQKDSTTYSDLSLVNEFVRSNNLQMITRINVSKKKNKIVEYVFLKY
jgi:hypothetical protein